MNSAEVEAWTQFLTFIESAQAALDGCVPVALICLPVERTESDGSLSIRHEDGGRIIWPSTLSVVSQIM